MNTRNTALIACMIAALTLAVACGDDEETPAATTANNATANNATDNSSPEDTGEDTGDGEEDAEPDTAEPDVPDDNPPGWSACGGFIPRGDAMMLEECGACVDDNCCDEAAACGDDPDCLALRECFAACGVGDRDCLEVCDAMSNDAINALNRPMITCRNTSCGDVCAPITDWTCLGEELPAPVSAAGPIQLGVTISDFQRGEVVAGVTVKLCAREDTMCETPLGEATTDAEGKLGFDLEIGAMGFDGYIDATGGGRVPTISYFRVPVTESIDLTFSVLSQATFDLFTAVLGLTPDAERGTVAALLQDCSNRGGAGVVYSATTEDAMSSVGYILAGVPNPEATATDSSGIGAIFNLPVGATTFTGARQDDGVAVFEAEAFVRAGYLTVLSQEPNR